MALVGICCALMTTIGAAGAYSQGMSMPMPTPQGTPQKAGPCPTGQHLDAMKMCVPDEESPSSMVMFNLNQFLVYSDTSGPRGESRVTGPGHWSFMASKAVSGRHQLSLDLMGSLEQWTVGDKGTPQLLQTEHVDAMHAHDTLMVLEFRDTVALGPNGARHLTLLFAPRGEAAVGPVPFMHRESAEGNPDAPLGHSLQDGFHDASSVFGLAYHAARTTAEVSTFSGRGESWPFPVHTPDSFSVRLNQGINEHVGTGASIARVLTPEDTGAVHNRFITMWLTTSHVSDRRTLKSSLVWGQARDAEGQTLHSVLEEVVFQTGKNKVYGRAEALQVTAEQLDIALAASGTDAMWVRAYTAGYERTLIMRGPFTLFGGGSYTRDGVPRAFQSTYGSGPRGFKAALRITSEITRRPAK